MPAVAVVMVPLVPALRREPTAVSEEAMRLVEEAVVAVIIVVLAYGMESAEDAGAEKLMVRALAPTRAAVPDSEIAVPAMAEEVATFANVLTPEK